MMQIFRLERSIDKKDFKRSSQLFAKKNHPIVANGIMGRHDEVV